MSEKQEQMVFENMNLVYFVLKKLNLYSQQEELFDLGLIGLIKGVKTFDESKNISLSTYLFKCIKNEILAPMRKKRCETVSIETVIGEDITLLDTIKDETIDIENEVAQNDLLENILKFIKTLPFDEQFVINSFFGINGSKRMRQQEISNSLGVSQAQISRKISKIVKKIKEAIL